MRKLFATLCMILSLVLALGFTACSGGNSGNSNTGNTPSIDNTPSSSQTGTVDDIDPSTFPKIRPYRDYNTNYMVFRNFEQWGPDFQLTRIGNFFGKISRQSGYGYGADQENYVAFGDYSMKIQAFSNPTLYFPTVSKLFDYDYSDFSNVQYVSMWIYNDNDTEMTVQVGVVGQITGANTFVSVEGEKTKLDPKAWTRVCYLIEPNFASIAFDANAVEGLYIQFPASDAEEFDEAPTYYVDEIVLNYWDTKPVVPDLITLDTNEIMSFDKGYQRYVTGTKCKKSALLPTIEVVRASDYGVEATSGDYVLRVLIPQGTVSWDSWPGIVIPEKIMQHSNLKNIPEDDLSLWKIEFDIMGGEHYGTLAFPNFYSAGGKNWLAYNMPVYSRRWSTFSESLSVLQYKRTSDPGNIGITFPEHTGAYTEEYFFDSFRIVRA